MKHKINLIKYEYTFNKGNYESEKIGIELHPGEDATAAEVLAEAKSFVHDGQEPSNEEQKDAAKNKRTNDAAGRKSKTTKKVEEEDEEITDEEGPKGKGISKKHVSKEDDSDDEEKPKAGKKKARGASPYDRSDETHKKLFSEKLDQEIPTWRDKKSKEAKDASVELNGSDFLDNDGDVVPEFTAKLMKLMK